MQRFSAPNRSLIIGILRFVAWAHCRFSIRPGFSARSFYRPRLLTSERQALLEFRAFSVDRQLRPGKRSHNRVGRKSLRGRTAPKPAALHLSSDFRRCREFDPARMAYQWHARPPYAANGSTTADAAIA